MKLFKNMIIFLLLSFILIPNILAKTNDYPYLEEIEFSNVKSKNILLYNLNDNKILYEKNSNEKIMIASLTKIMSVMVAIENIDNLNEVVTVPKEAFLDIDGYATAGFKVFDKVTYQDLLYGTMLPSGIDAVQSLAILLFGDIQTFVDAMNELAFKLNMHNTHYNNPVGKDNENNYSTLTDLAKLLFYALDNETFYEIYTSRNYITLNNLELNSTLINPSKKYNLNIENILGAKSGFTSKAGLCLASIAEYNGVKYLLITAGSLYEQGLPNHIIDSLTIYNYFWNNYSYQSILKENEILYTLDVKNGILKTYDIKSNENINLYLKNDTAGNVKYDYSGVSYLDRKIKENDLLGKVDITYDNNILYTYNVYLNENVKYKNYYLIILVIPLVMGSLFLIKRIIMFFAQQKLC